MTTLYAESSAILRWLLGTPDGPQIAALLATASHVVSSALTGAEVGRALHCHVARNQLSPGERDRAWARFSAAASHWSVAAIDAPLLARVSEGFACEPLRALDAIHLATATRYALATQEPVTLVSTDTRVRDNARALGLSLAP